MGYCSAQNDFQIIFTRLNAIVTEKQLVLTQTHNGSSSFEKLLDIIHLNHLINGKLLRLWFSIYRYSMILSITCEIGH